jgi:hypothetical protein
MNPSDKQYLDVITQLAQSTKEVMSQNLPRAEKMSQIANYVANSASELGETPLGLLTKLRGNVAFVGTEITETVKDMMNKFSPRELELIRKSLVAGAPGALVPTTSALTSALATLSGAMNSVGTYVGTYVPALGATAGTTAATVTGTIVTGGAALLAVFILSHLAGIMSADKPVAEIPHLVARTTSNADPAPAIAPKPGEKYGVYLAGNDIISGQLGVILEMPSSSLIGWGLDNSKKVKDMGRPFELKAGPFDTAAEAGAAYEDSKVAGSEHGRPLGLGPVATFKFDGKEHSVDNATRFLH